MPVGVNGIDAITLFVDDLEQARSFYVKVFSLPVHFEDADSCVLKFGSTLVNLLTTGAVPELIGPARAGSRRDGNRFQLTVEVADVDAACAELAAQGVRLLNGPVDRPWGVRTACFQDPDGHIWELAATRC